MRDRIRISHPCAENWAAMPGDEKSRFCAACAKPVHRLEALTDDELAALLASGPVCLRRQAGPVSRRAALALLVTISAAAQQPPGIYGVVVDPSGAVLPGALVTLPDGRSARTDVTGRFAFPDLPPGRYALTVTGDGFQTGKAQVDLGAARAELTVTLRVSQEVMGIVVEAGTSSRWKRTLRRLFR